MKNPLKSKEVKEISHTKKTVIDYLYGAIANGNLDINEKNAISLAIEEVGKCFNCSGTGKTIVAFKPHNNYSIKYTPQGTALYLTECAYCKATGKILETKCYSCAKDADILVSQRHLQYCASCEEKFINNGKLI